MLLVLATTGVHSATYYVAASGSDGAAGTLAAPYLTIKKAADRMAAGDTCMLRTGVYRETIIPAASGAAGRPIVFMAFSGDNVFVSAADPITGWTKDGSTPFYKAPMGWDLGQGRNQVFANGETMYEARIPNFDAPSQRNENVKRNVPASYQPASLMNFASMNCGGEQGAGVLKVWIGTVASGGAKLPRFFDSCRTANAPQEFFAGAMVHKTGGYWEAFSGIVAPGWGVEPASASMMPGWMYIKVNAPNWEAGGGRFVFSGLRCLLDGQREWFLENGTILFRPPNDADPSTLLIEAKRRQQVMDLRDRDYIEVRGLRFLGGGVAMKGSDNCVIDNCNFRYITHWSMHHGYNMDYRYNGESAFYIEGNNNKFTNSSIEYSAGSGIYLQGIGNTIDNNLVSDCDYLGGYDAGVVTGSKVAGTNMVTRNTIRNMGRSAWTLTPGTPGETMTMVQKLLYNNMYNCMFHSEDGGTVYLAGSNGGGCEFAYNWMWNMIQTWNGHHIYYDWGGGFHTVIHHNVFWQDSSWMSENNALTTAPMRHVTYNNTSLQSPRSDVYKPFDDDERGVNALWANGDYAGWGIKDYPNRDFTLVAGSKAIDKGIFRADSQYVRLWDYPNYRAECYLLDTGEVWLIPDSAITGSKPDLGAYEYGKPRWVPGHTWGDPVWVYPPATGSANSSGIARGAGRAAPRCIAGPHGMTISMVNVGDFTVQVMDVAGRTVLTRGVKAGRTLLIPSSQIPQSTLLVRVTATGAQRTFRTSLVR